MSVESKRLEDVRRVLAWEDLTALRSRLVLALLRVLLPVGGVALVGGAFNAYQGGDLLLIPIYGLAYTCVVFITLWRKSPYILRAGVLLFVMYAMALLNFSVYGLSGDGRVFLLTFIFAAFLFLGRREGYWSLALAGITLLIFSLVFYNAPIIPSIEVQAQPAFLVSTNIVFLMLGCILVFSLNYLLPQMSQALAHTRALIGTLEGERQQVEDALQQAQMQGVHLRLALDVGQSIAWAHDEQQLLERATFELSRRFDFEQVDLFLMDAGGLLHLVASAGAYGQQWVGYVHQMRAELAVLPVQVARMGKSEAVRSEQHPRYPASQSEAAFPLQMHGEILGVLDVYIRQEQWDAQLLEILDRMADQLAANLNTLRSLAEAEARNREMQRAYAQTTMEMWQLFLEEDRAPAYLLGEVPQAQARALAEESFRTRHAVSGGGGPEGQLLVVPLINRGVALGYLALLRKDTAAAWDAEIRALLEDAAGRLAVSIDNTRLLLTSRRRAFYEEQLGRLGDLVWASPSTEAVMENSVRELGRLLGAEDVLVYLTPAANADTFAAPGTQPLSGYNTLSSLADERGKL